MNIRKTCPYCGKVFTPYQRRQVACRDPRCRAQHIKETRLAREAWLAENQPKEWAARCERERKRRAEYWKLNWRKHSERVKAWKQRKRAEGYRV